MPSLTGSFLVARPVLEDPSFNQSVVLLLQHSPEGALGLVVNRPAKVGGVPFPVFSGGPCEAEGLLMLHGHADWACSSADEQAPAVAPGIYLGNASCLGKVNEAPVGQDLRYRLFLGYAGWGAGQLEGELAAGAWGVTAATGELLFDTPVEDLWDRLSPPSIPQPSVN